MTGDGMEVTSNLIVEENGMKLLIKQRVFSWTDTYDVYDEAGNPKYFVKAEFFTLGHQIHVYDMNHNEIEIGGRDFGTVQKEFTFFKPKYDINYNGWRCEGDFLAWDYDVYSGCSVAVHISKEVLHWGDTYVIDIVDPADEIMALMLTIAIDAANCSNSN